MAQQGAQPRRAHLDKCIAAPTGNRPLSLLRVKRMDDFMQDKKTAYTLYRVSTSKQLEKDSKDDIPMQRQACREFAVVQGWQIGREFEEKGISGYKVSAENRDAIQDLKEAALKGQLPGLICTINAI